MTASPRTHRPPRYSTPVRAFPPSTTMCGTSHGLFPSPGVLAASGSRTPITTVCHSPFGLPPATTVCSPSGLITVTGPDLNRDGLPDVLQRGLPCGRLAPFAHQPLPPVTTTTFPPPPTTTVLPPASTMVAPPATTMVAPPATTMVLPPAPAVTSVPGAEAVPGMPTPVTPRYHQSVYAPPMTPTFPSGTPTAPPPTSAYHPGMRCERAQSITITGLDTVGDGIPDVCQDSQLLQQSLVTATTVQAANGVLTITGPDLNGDGVPDILQKHGQDANYCPDVDDDNLDFFSRGSQYLQKLWGGEPKPAPSYTPMQVTTTSRPASYVPVPDGGPEQRHAQPTTPRYYHRSMHAPATPTYPPATTVFQPNGMMTVTGPDLNRDGVPDVLQAAQYPNAVEQTTFTTMEPTRQQTSFTAPVRSTSKVVPDGQDIGNIFRMRREMHMKSRSRF